MDQAMNIHFNWHARTCLIRGLSKFESGWEILMTVAESAPALAIHNETMWDLYYDVSTHSLSTWARLSKGQPLAVALGTDSLREKYNCEDVVQRKQSHFSHQYVVNAMSEEKFLDTKVAITSFAKGVLECPAHWPAAEVKHATCLCMLVEPPPLTLDSDQHQCILDTLKKVTDPMQCKGSLLAPIHEYPMRGKQLYEQSQNHAKSFDELHHYWRVVQNYVVGEAPDKSVPWQMMLQQASCLVLAWQDISTYHKIHYII